jgi:type I restriction enzyme, S subunit
MPAKAIKSETQRIPKLRFPAFSGAWEEKKLEEICSFTQGVQVPQAEQINIKKNGYIRYLYIRDFFTDKFLCYVKDIYPNKIIKSTEIMVVNTGNTAGEIFMGATGVLSNNSFKIGFDENIVDNNFLFSYLKSDRTQNKIKSFFNSGGQPHLGHNNIGMVPFIFPLKREQEKIADFLGSTDDLINNLKEQKENLESYKKGMMQKIFSQEIRFKDEKGKDFPGWEEKKLGEMGSVRTSNVDKISNPNEKEVKLLNYMDVYKRDHIFASDTFQVVTAKDSQISSCDLKKGDVMFTPSSETSIDIGHSAVIMENLPDTVFSYHVVRFRPKRDLLIYGFSAYAFKSFSFYKKLWRRAQGATRFTLSLETFNEVSVLIPKSLEEQQKIADFLISVDKVIESKQQQITEAEQWKKGLMQGLFL